VLGNAAASEHWLRRALTDDPQDAYAHSNLLLLLLMEGRDDEARAHAERMVADHPGVPVLRGHAGLVAWYTGDLAQATAWLEAAAAEDPTLWIGTWGTLVTQPLGEIYWRQGRYDEARAAFASAVAGYRQRFERASEGWGYRHDLAGMAAVQGEHDEAYGWLQDTIDFGWTDYVLARRDPALAALHGEDQFRSMMAELERRVATARVR
jgi:tetratricopeptide (TPR) repeat protein